MEVTNNNMDYVAKLQSFGIFLVVLGHGNPFTSADITPAYLNWLHSIIYSFHMPLFMFISGLLFFYTNKNREFEYGKFILKKVRRLLVPYLIISTCAFFPKSLLQGFAQRSVDVSVEGYLMSLVYPSENPIIFFLVFTQFVLHIHGCAGHSKSGWPKPGYYAARFRDTANRTELAERIRYTAFRDWWRRSVLRVLLSRLLSRSI